MKLSTKELVICSIFASITAILAQISIPIPFTTVPLTMQMFSVMICGILLGSRLGFLSQVIYLSLGIIGIPVFSQMGGGIGVLAGPTGGFLISFPIVSFIVGYFFEKYKNNILLLLSMLIALFISYIIGTFQFSLIAGVSFFKGLLTCVVPFIIVDFIKIGLVYIFGKCIRKRINLKNI
ncbi:biotin transporter BioY [Romboutsia sp. 1001713B170131_170501_G6]|uniref:biotin transporter BioY n=1 Tax=Romboutsia sp. 1001713B170131_170501_G6 TaxID=2787108 RepID=UPI0018AB9C3A|nr:biotin transporter BioY [Romboutsia sp. 1001713B170131_170501_G6]